MNIKNRQQVLAVLAMTAVALFAADKLIRAPLARLWQDRSARIASLRKQVAEGVRLRQREQGLRSRWDQMRTNTLPNNPSLAEEQVLKAFDRWSQESRISVTSITPQWKRGDTDEFMTLECRVDASGDLATLSRFLYNIERDPLALKLESVEISARDKDGQQLALGLQLSGLVLIPQTQ